jgi:hypothetical protein
MIGLAVSFAVGSLVGGAITVLGFVSWSIYTLHNPRKRDQVYELPTYSYRSRN